MIPPDPYGIPEGIFGAMSPELPALLGRIVMLAALLETKVEAVVSSIGTGTQDVYAGEPVRNNLQLAIKLLALYKSTEQERQFSHRGTTILEEIGVALEQRNALVHRVWSRSGMDEWGGWKPLRKKQRNPSSPSFTDWDDVTPADLTSLITTMVDLVEQISVFIGVTGSLPRKSHHI